jgi:MFS family permease
MNEDRPGLMIVLRALPRPVWILFFGTFLNKFGTFVIPFLALYMTRRGFSLLEAGWAMSAYGLGHLIAAALGGYLADRIGRRKTITLSMVSSGTAMLLLSQAESLSGIIWLIGLAGLTAELYRPACNALLTDLVPAAQRVSAFAAYRLAINAGWAFGPAIAGFLADRSYFWLFVGDALTSFLFGLTAWFLLPHGVRGGKDDAGWKPALRRMGADGQYLRVLLASFLIALVFLQMTTTFGMHIIQLGFSPAVYGALMSLNGVLVVLFELPLTTVTQRHPAQRVMALGYLLIGSGFAFNIVAHTVSMLFVCVLLYTLGEMIVMPVSSAVIANLSPEEMRGRYMGAYGLTWAMALAIGPSAGTFVFSTNPQLLWGVCGMLGVIAALVTLSGRRLSADGTPLAAQAESSP